MARACGMYCRGWVKAAVCSQLLVDNGLNCLAILSTLIFMLNTRWSEMVIDAHWLCFKFTAAAAGCWRPAARPAGQLAETEKTLRISLRAEQRSSCWLPDKRKRNQGVSQRCQLFWVLYTNVLHCRLRAREEEGHLSLHCKLSWIRLCHVEEIEVLL